MFGIRTPTVHKKMFFYQIGLGLFVPDVGDDSSDSFGYLIGRIAVIICSHQKNDHLKKRLIRR